MIKRNLQFQDYIGTIYPPVVPEIDGEKVLSRTATLQVTDDCNLSCSYCYQINKGKHSMSFETAKKYIDWLLEATSENNTYINPVISPGIVLEFIGGEPLLEIDLIDKVTDYFINQMIEKNHPWLMKYMISICSNGVLYHDSKVQKYLKRNKNNISFSISIDGNKELHDSCRVFPDGSGSYDIAMSGVKHYKEVLKGTMGSKMTLCPQNISHTFEAVQNLLEVGYREIFLNCVYEEGWTPKDATILYYQLKQLSDYIIDNDLYNDVYLSIFEENLGYAKAEDDVQNWCFKAGTSILTTQGSKAIEDIKIGDTVISGENNSQLVSNLMKHTANNTIEIKAAGMLKTFTTTEHPFRVKRFLYIGNKGVYRYSSPEWVEAKDIKKKDKIALHCHTFGSVSVDSHLAYIVGRYIGDGWNSTTGFKLCCNYNEYEYLSQRLDEANIKYSTNDYKTVRQINIFKENEKLLSILSDAGKLAHGKKIPEEVFNWDKESVKSLIDGYLDADGSFRPHSKMWKMNTVSITLFNDLMILLRGLGYNPMCYHNKRAGTQLIEGRKVNVRDRYEIYFHLDNSRSRYCEYDKENNVVWSTVYNAEQSTQYDVFNLTVENDHSYIANGAVVHNCGGTGAMISMDYKGDIYPCIRYMESSLGDDIEPMIIGNINTGILATAKQKSCVDCLKCIDRKTQSTDECFNCPIAEGCSWCFKAGTLISTPNGLTAIEKLKIGDKVLSGTGQVQGVSNINKRYTDDTVSLKASGIPIIDTTSEHPFLAKTLEGTSRNRFYSSPKWVKAKDLKANDRIALNIPKLGDIHIDSEVAYLAGRYLGDGWTVASNRKTPRYYLCCNYNECSDLEKHFSGANVSFCKDKFVRTAQEYFIHTTNHSAENNNELLIRIISDAGKYAHGKRVPNEVFLWDKESVSHFLHGYFEADGYFDKIRNTYKFCTVSKELAEGIASLLRAFGKKTAWCTRKNQSAVIQGRKVNTHTAYECSIPLHTPKKTMCEIDEENNIMWVTVRNNNNAAVGGYDVYNLTVENEHTFIADGAIVHNCSALNYQLFGTADHRATFICIMHKARALANTYFHNKAFAKYALNKVFKNHVPKEWALEIISQKELESLNELEMRLYK